MTRWWRDRIHRSPEPIDLRGRRRWRSLDDGWKPWIRRSARGLELLTRCREADEYLYLLGYEAYRDQLVDLLSASVPRDCAAAGLACSRSQWGCREPEVCARDPDTADDRTGRPGPVPGGCGAFHGSWGDDLTFHVSFSAGDRHRAVVWRDRRELERETLWIDGVPVGGEEHLDRHGRWADDRFFVVQAGGPDDHPAQEYTFGLPVTRISSLLIHDADRASGRLLVPGPEEMWTDPTVLRHGDELWIYPDRAAADAGTPPDRTLPVT